MAEPKTRPTGADVKAFLDAVDDDRRRAEGHALRELMERVTGAPATMWGPSLVGFGDRTYPGRSGETDWFIVGFSPRKAALSIYGLYHGTPDPLLDELGPHTTGRGCLYVKQLDAVDLGVLERLVEQGWQRF